MRLESRLSALAHEPEEAPVMEAEVMETPATAEPDHSGEVTEMVKSEADEDATLQARAAELFDLLDWQPAERAKWLYGVTKKYTELKDITAGPLAKVVGALERKVAELNEREER